MAPTKRKCERVEWAPPWFPADQCCDWLVTWVNQAEDEKMDGRLMRNTIVPGRAIVGWREGQDPSMPPMNLAIEVTE